MKKNIQLYNSFEEMENKQLLYFASLEPEIILQHLKSLILIVYGYKEDPLLKNMQRIIHFNEEK